MATTNDQKAKVTLYWLEESRAQRIVWLLEECKIDYEIKVYKRYEMRADPELKKIHPLGKAPVVGIEAPGAQPFILAESGLIIEYLTEHFAPHLAPQRYAEGKGGVGQETESWLRYRYFMHYVEGSLMPPLVMNLITNVLKGPAVPFFIRPITRGICDKLDAEYYSKEYENHFSFLEGQLATSPEGGEYLCGKDLTSADILMSFPLQAAKSAGHIKKEKCPKLIAYIERLEAHPVAKQAIEKIEKLTGEPYKLSGRD